MSGILRNILRSNVVKTASMSVLRQSMGSGMNNSIRGLAHMTRNPGRFTAMNNSWHKSSFGCSCGCGNRFNHAEEGSAELLDVLEKEIESEKKQTNKIKIPTSLGGFEVKYDNADIELVKQEGNERIEIVLNVNHTVDIEAADAYLAGDDNDDYGDLKSKPSFEVNIIKDGTTLSFTCEFLKDEPANEEYEEIFAIKEILVYRGEYTDKVYACTGDMLDNALYDALIKELEKRGVTTEFVFDLSDLSTNYERSLYIKFLESLKTFA